MGNKYGEAIPSILKNQNLVPIYKWLRDIELISITLMVPGELIIRGNLADTAGK